MSEQEEIDEAREVFDNDSLLAQKGKAMWEAIAAEKEAINANSIKPVIHPFKILNEELDFDCWWGDPNFNEEHVSMK